MSIRSFIGANTGVQDVFFLGTKLSPFAYKGWTVSTNFMLERKEYDPMTSPAFGQSVKFQYPNDCDLAGPVTLVIKLPRLNLDIITDQFAVGAGDPRYVDGVGWHCINRIEIKYGANLLQTIKPEDMEIRAELFEPDEILKYTRENVLEGMSANDLHNISKAPESIPTSGAFKLSGIDYASAASLTNADKQSIVKFVKQRTCVVNLTTLFWGQTPNQWLPIFLLRDPNNLIIEVFFKNLNQLITRNVAEPTTVGGTTYTLPSSISADSTSKFEVKLRCTNVHLSQAEKAYFSARAGARGNKGGSTEDDGLLYKFQDYERHEREVINFSGTAEKRHTLRLSNFRSPTTSLIFILREKSRVEGVYNNTTSSTNDVALPGFDKDTYKYIEFNKVTANGNDLLREYDDKQTTVSEMLLYFPNGFKKNIYVRVINDLTPTDEINCVGSINFMNLNNPQLELRWSRADLVRADDHYLDVFAKTHQIIQLVNGQLHRLFN